MTFKFWLFFDINLIYNPYTNRLHFLGSGTVDFKEFQKMMSQTRFYNKQIEEQRKQIEEEEMRQAFKVFDIDGNGVIDAQELKLTMRNLGENLSDRDVSSMLDAADLNKDGKIDYEGLYFIFNYC